MSKELEGLVVEGRGNSAKGARREASKGVWQPGKNVGTHFAEGLVGNFHRQKPRTWMDFVVSVLAHGLVVAVLILLPLYFTEAINMPQFETTLLVAPPPPPPPPPAAVEVRPRVPKSFFTKGQLFQPKFIPKKVARIKEQAPPRAASGVVGGVVGGVPGGQLGGVLGGVLGGSGHAPAPAPPLPTPLAHRGPYRVGGKVQAPRLIHQVQPEYPPLARQARIQGDVIIDSVIDRQGRVTELKVVSGSPLLVESAIHALEQWRYQPTLLNGQPVAVDMLVTLHFTLGQDS